MKEETVETFYRSNDDVVLTGLLGGLGEYFGINPFVFRLIFLLFGVCSMFLPLFIPYLIASFIVKKRAFPLPNKNCVHLYRSRSNRRIAGVIGGVAQIYEVDVTVLRILFLLFSFFTVFPFTLTYLFSWALLPLER